MRNADMPAMPIALEPGEVWSEGQDHAHGLTKREQFAARAMQGFIAAPMGKYPDQTNQRVMAYDSLLAADALLAELEKTDA